MHSKSRCGVQTLECTVCIHAKCMGCMPAQSAWSVLTLKHSKCTYAKVRVGVYKHSKVCIVYMCS
ncbi:hypothetical protein CSUI_004350, partial [Cystoisospora suis]